MPPPRSWFCHGCSTEFVISLAEDDDVSSVCCAHCGGAFVELMPPQPPPLDRPDSPQDGEEEDLSDGPDLGEELGAAEIFFNLAFFSDDRLGSNVERCYKMMPPLPDATASGPWGGGIWTGRGLNSE
jgi:hypothetical protein